MTNTEKGSNGVGNVEAWLRGRGLKVMKSKAYRSPFDLLVNGWRVEVKIAEMNKRGKWQVNIHRHGKMTEDEVDFYVFCLRDVPLSTSDIYLVRRAPLKSKTVSFTVRSLLSRYASWSSSPLIDEMRESC